MSDQITVHLDVDMPDPCHLPHVVEVLARIQAALAMDGYEPRLNVWHYEAESVEVEEG